VGDEQPSPREGDVKRSGKSTSPDGAPESSKTVLRAKYLDYCSARVAEFLLRLSPDEIYLLAQEATRELNVENEESLSYSAIVRFATDRISSQLALPDFDSWAREYRLDPQRFERELLGLWEADLRTSDRGTP
jgi:hypothetical protein